MSNKCNWSVRVTEHTACEHPHLKKHVAMNRHKHTMMSDNSGRRQCCLIPRFLHLILPFEGLSHIWRHLSTCIIYLHVQLISAGSVIMTVHFPHEGEGIFTPFHLSLPSLPANSESKNEGNKWTDDRWEGIYFDKMP